ncbi:MAG: phosphoribosyl-ATP diphosphatase [Phycisphaerales bacterium]|jgi:phosphoribosyl-ATP pyrophosphohydrolase/phosphoribosyl-AMP cyclohydrolase
MMVPSVDLRGGNAVQLIGGKELAVDAGDPVPIAERFGLVGEVAVIDLDAAMGTGSNREVVLDLVRRVPCRVGGGIRDAGTAIELLDAGARRVILGTAATPDVLQELPRERVIAALDARDGEVVDKGWTRATGRRVEDRIAELREHVGGFLVTFVEQEGGLGGWSEAQLQRIAQLVELAGPARLTVAGGVKTPADVAAVDRLGADAQVGMALYTGAFDLAEGFCAPLQSDRPDGLWPTIVADPGGRSLGLVYSNLESVRASIERRRGVYYSRSRGGLWAKGETSGNVQELLGISVDCDRDALRFTVRQRGAFCHAGTTTCFGESRGLASLDATLAERVQSPPTGSYTARLLDDPSLLRAKLLEEAGELIDAESAEDAAHEAADVAYFALVAARARGATLESLERELDRRSLRVTRRPGNAKVNIGSDA